MPKASTQIVKSATTLDNLWYFYDLFIVKKNTSNKQNEEKQNFLIHYEKIRSKKLKYKSDECTIS